MTINAIWVAATIILGLWALFGYWVGRWGRVVYAVAAWFVLTALLYLNADNAARLADQAGPFVSGLTLVILLGAVGVLAIYVTHLVGGRVLRTFRHRDLPDQKNAGVSHVTFADRHGSVDLRGTERHWAGGLLSGLTLGALLDPYTNHPSGTSSSSLPGPLRSRRRSGRRSGRSGRPAGSTTSSRRSSGTLVEPAGRDARPRVLHP